MTKRYIPILAVVACLSVAGGTAFATDEPPPASPPASPPTTTDPTADPTTDDGSATIPANPIAANCVDTSKPRSRAVSKSAAAVKKHVLRGTVTDAGACKGDSAPKVSVSIVLKHAKRCQYVTSKAKLTRPGKCKTRWIKATGTAKNWHVKLPKKLKHGSYKVSTRAVDSAGNVERAHARRLAVRQSRSSTNKK